MKIAAYNIMSGGFNSYSDNASHPERLPILCQAVKKINADFIGLIDTFRWDKLYSDAEIKNIFNYKHAFCLNLNDERLRKLGHNNGITVLTNIDGVRFAQISLATRDAVKAKFIGKSRSLDIFTIYLDDMSEETRMVQLKKLLSLIDSDPRAVIMGDFNTSSPDDANEIKETVKNLIAQHPFLSKKLYHALEKIEKTDVIKLLINRGFINASKPGNNTVPTPLLRLPVPFTGPWLRLDYVFYTPNVQVNNFRVLQDEIFEQASDHFPIVFEIEL